MAARRRGECVGRTTPRPALGGFFGNQRVSSLSCLRSCDFHFLPVVAKFFATVETGDVSARPLTRLGATRTGANRNGKTVASVPAAEHGFHQPREHLDSLHRK